MVLGRANDGAGSAFPQRSRGWINPLDYAQVYGIHIATIPLIILGLLGLHYLLVRVLGIAKPYRSDVVAPTVKANHGLLFMRAGVLLDPYTFNTGAVFADQQAALQALSDYYGQDQPDPNALPKGPATDVTASLTSMAAAGLYEPALLATNLGSKEANVATYASRFLADTGVLEDQATQLNITTEQYGMIREETGNTPGAWWLSPIGLLNHTVLANDENGDRDAAIIFGSLLLTMLAFPFIPYLNQLPDVLKVHALIWRKEHKAAKQSAK